LHGLKFHWLEGIPDFVKGISSLLRQYSADLLIVADWRCQFEGCLNEHDSDAFV
jgi:hypothetical protein